MEGQTLPNRAWTEADNVRLKSLAGKIPAKDIAAQLERSVGATIVQASKLKASLSMRRRVRSVADPGPAGFGEIITADVERTV